jgi:hypothetical protein
MVNPRRFRADVPAAVRDFRPILVSLNIRDRPKHRAVFIAEFDHLDLLNFDECSIQVLVADLDECIGMFISSSTTSGLCRCYIVLNKSLFDNTTTSGSEQLKITGVHEFIHFLAFLYAATTVDMSNLKESIRQRLNTKIDSLPHDRLIKIYNLLTDRAGHDEDPPEELTDKHFRLDIEGDTPDYNILFNNFMFSRDLFETDFTSEKQAEFKRLAETNQESKAIDLLIESLKRVASAKAVPFKLAYKQLMTWVRYYSPKE